MTDQNSNQYEVYETLHFRSVQDPYTCRSSVQSTLCTKNVHSMLSGGLERFYEKYQHLSSKVNVHLPTPELHFDGLAYVVECPQQNQAATVGSHLDALLNPFKTIPTHKKTILHAMDGIIKPGSFTLVLGGPGSGKSTFLKALANKLPIDQKKNQLHGQVSYSGMTAGQLQLNKLIGLVDQIDDHCPTLTVRETIKFADVCQNGRVEDNPESLQGIAALRTELILYLLGLTNCADTIVGDALLRGVSGGERKRVTVGEMLVGGQSIFLCDEISTGLDSAATFDIMTSLRSWAQTLGGTAIVALLQPPPEVVELFDDIMLFSAGHLVYHGPRTFVLKYFYDIGFTCPPRVDPADFLIDVTAGRGYEFRNGVMKDDELPMNPTDFAELFKSSDIKKQVNDEINKGYSLPSQIESNAYFQHFRSVAQLANSKGKSTFAMDFIPSTLFLMRRQALLFFRDKPLLYGKLMEAIVVGLILGMIYFNAPSELYLRMLFFAVAIFQRQSWQFITLAMQLRSVFYKQRSRNFFRSSSYGLADALVQIPVNLTVSILMGTVFYCMSGLYLQLSNYLIFILVLILYQHAIGSFFTMLSALSPNMTIAQGLAGTSVCFFLLFSGNIILADLIPSYWIWMYWFDPISWALRCVILNEFTSDFYSHEESQNRLAQFQISQSSEYIGIGMMVLFVYYIVFTCAQTIILHYIRYDKKTQALQSEGTLKNKDIHIEIETTTYSKTSQTGEQSENHFTPAYLCINNLEYVVPGKKKGETIQLLHGITANFKPNTMTALMGSSGAGKTTLLDVIAGRKTGGSISGEVIINGKQKNPVNFSRIAAYCEQMDIHSSAATVRESLLFSANLRLPSTMTGQARVDIVDDTMALLELTPLADQIVGSTHTGGLSVEQRKRLTIACELVMNPSILFLDEPTSGLDARSALLVMQAVRRIASSGRTVVCTIHQPSVQIFNLFDSLLLLQRGGYTAYFGELGEESELMLEYFAAIPGTKAIQPQYNPATYMLEVIGAGIGRSSEHATNYAMVYKESDLAQRNATETMKWGKACAEIKPFPDYDQYATSLRTQIYFTAIKAAKTYWRSPSYNFARIILYPMFAIVFGTTFYQLGRDTPAKVNSQIALIYNNMDFIGVINMMTVLEITCNERAVFYRERSSNMYSVFPYSFAIFLAEFPYLLFVSCFFVGIEYWLVGLQQHLDSFMLYWFIFFLYISICTFVGQWMCALMPNAKVASVAVGAISCLFSLFSGYLLPFVYMKSYYSWITYVMPSSYALNALVSTQMGNCENGIGNGCTVITLQNGTVTTVSSFIDENYGFDVDHRFSDLGILIGVWFFIQASIYLTFRFVNHLNR